MEFGYSKKTKWDVHLMYRFWEEKWKIYY
jgi:hypothetical protein